MSSVGAFTYAQPLSKEQQGEFSDKSRRSKHSASVNLNQFKGANQDLSRKAIIQEQSNRHLQEMRLTQQRLAAQAIGQQEYSDGDEDQIADSFKKTIQKDRRSQIKEKYRQVKGRATAPARRITSKLLIGYWKTLISSWGATLLLIDLHVLGRFSLGTSFFCKLGHEWAEMLNIPASRTQSGQNIKERMGRKIGVLEATLVALLNIILLIVILVVIVLITIIVATLIRPWWVILDVLEWLYNSIF
ncbi:MAG: hypothetical protein ABIG10_03865 [bacterium]